MGYTPPTLLVNKITGGWSLSGPSTAVADDLTIYPNSTATTSRIELLGGSYMAMISGGNIILGLNASTTSILTLAYATPDFSITPLAEKNLFLNPTGAGRVKFGAYTAGAATDSTGYIDILDAAGNVRKLMVQA